MKIKLVLILLLASVAAFAQNGSISIDESIDLIRKQKDVTFFEVSKEMFQMLSEAKNISPELKTYYSQLTKIRMIEDNNRNYEEGNTDEFYNSFLEQTNLKNYTLLMVSEERREKISFFKREGSNDENQFLLLTNKSIIYVCGSIDLKSIHEFQMIMQVAGSAFGH
ncbi:DUF4252 domain-containing protein [Sunxiuqinia sp. A32]|uniref:DUF4252 domain-containing protein n=1 Tax=Sunxiuqinia sp. A32 TaxID=3461496 RepID=UPI004045B9F9